ncbi:ribonuclease P protein component [Jutongia sp.]|uniref:ribonuclease P protein component n=1 Tax=Jutongia sp. TaxID=2944204 RepID=UPI00095FE1B5|nr:MAG: ribonuclease P protein component [Clostridium sp. 44_14]
MVFQKIRKNIEFLNVYRHGKSYANKYLVMYVLNNKLDENRFGITVSKKVGNSVVRHRITRLIRECIRLQESNILTEYDIVIVARKAAKDKKYQDIESAFLNLCKRQNILKR